MNANETQYQWTVEHPEHGKTEVIAQDKLHALYEAARRWQVRWTSIARACTFTKEGLNGNK